MVEPTTTPDTPVLTAEDVIARTRQLVAEAFRAENSGRQAGRTPRRLTMSGLGGCTRHAVYCLAGTPPTDTPTAEEGRAALLGTWIHDGLLPAMARQIGDHAVTEVPVTLRAAGQIITGTLDLADHDTVWDLKTVREWRLDGVRRHGTYDEHRMQVMGYALARHQSGHPVRWVCWLYLDRSTGELHIIAEPFTNSAAMTVIDRVTLLCAYADSDPDAAPRDERGPGLSYVCDRCAWLRRCWGDDALPGEVGVQRSLAATPEGIEAALELYATGAAAASRGRKDQEFAKAILAGVPDNTYGRWILAHGRPAVHEEESQVEGANGARKRGPSTRQPVGRIIVKPAPQGV